MAFYEGRANAVLLCEEVEVFFPLSGSCMEKEFP